MQLGIRLDTPSGPGLGVERLDGHTLSSIGRDAQEVLDRATDYVAVLHPEGQWVWASEPLLRLVGTDVNYGSTFSSFVNPNDIEAFESSMALASSTPGVPVDTTLRVWAPERNRWTVIEGTITSYTRVPGIDGLLLTATDVTRRVEAEAALRRAATRDPLTGLPNRVLLFERLVEAAARARRRDESFAVLFLDLDRFKSLNDTLGHAAGDRFLVELARRLRARLRAEDTLARLGGDEFVIVTGAQENEEGLTKLCEVVLEEAARPIDIAGHSISLGASIGVVLSRGERDPEGILRDADVAMYEAKSARRGCWVMHEEEMTVRVSTDFRMRERIVEIVEADTIGLALAPILDWRVRDVVAASAGPRIDVDGVTLAARDAAEAAESQGLAVRYGTLVLRTALAAAASWRPHRCVLVPAATGFLADPSSFGIVKDLLEQSGVGPERLVLDIGTDSTVVTETQWRVTVDSLRGAGVRLAVSGFGVEPAALDLVGSLPVDFLKVPEPVIRRFVETENSRVLDAVAAMSVPLQLEVIAEGVSDPETAEQIARHGLFLSQR